MAFISFSLSDTCSFAANRSTANAASALIPLSSMLAKRPRSPAAGAGGLDCERAPDTRRRVQRVAGPDLAQQGKPSRMLDGLDCQVYVETRPVQVTRTRKLNRQDLLHRGL